MSISNLSRGDADFRAAAGLARYPAEPDIAPDDLPAPRGPGLFEVVSASGQRAVTNVRRLAGADRTPGSRLILAAALLLGLLAAAFFVVTLAAQYHFVLSQKHETIPSLIEGLGLDAGMAVFSLLALGLAMAGQSARIERALVVACALASGGMNYAAAVVTSPRSVLVFVMPPIFLAVTVDRVVAVVRRHVLGDAERSAWAGLGRLAAFLGMAALYALRFVLAPPSTAGGLRRQVLIMAPLPAAERPVIEPNVLPAPPEVPAIESKRARLERAYRAHPDAWDRSKASKTATELAGQIGMSAGTARSVVNELLKRGAS
jgi:Protein of unknown function (DUF2637)